MSSLGNSWEGLCKGMLPPGTSLGTFLVLRYAWRALGRPHSLGPEVIQGTPPHNPPTVLDVSRVGNCDFSRREAPALADRKASPHAFPCPRGLWWAE